MKDLGVDGNYYNKPLVTRERFMTKCFKLSFSTKRASLLKVGVAEKPQTVRFLIHEDNSR